MSMTLIWDVETYPNCFLLSAKLAGAPFCWSYEISDYRNDSAEIIRFVNQVASMGGRMVGFNSIGFDYPILHMLCKMGHSDAMTLYTKAMAIIGSQDGEGRWAHTVKPSDRAVEQIDLYLIHHFDNKARATSLKVLEFNMRADNIADLPFPVGTMLTSDQIEVLREYNKTDIENTERFYFESLPMIRFREELTTRFQRDFMNHNDTKIGKDYFTMRLEAAGVECYTYDEKGRNPKQTRRRSIDLKDAILPWISFREPEFQRILEWLKSQTITETKGVFKDVTAIVNGFEFVFGLGGIHGSVEKERIESDEQHVIVDLDVSSYYPNLAIANRFYPEHLGESFCDIFKVLYDQRKGYAKGSAENAMLKLALNGVYGDSNNQFSIFYDPLFTMKITLNGQLLLCMLAEKLMALPGIRMIQINTDGMSLVVPRNQLDWLRTNYKIWESMTGLQLEEAHYRQMLIADVNNYIAQYEDGKVKRKGRYEYDLEWHQNHSALVVQKIAEQVLLYDAPIRETLESWPDIMDFMLRVKVPRNSFLKIEYTENVEEQLQNTTRYYVAHGGGHLFKWMPPLKGSQEWRRIGIESGWGVQVCNDLRDPAPRFPIDYDYYVREVEKLVLGVM